MPNFTSAIIEFLANEFKLEPSQITPDLDFVADLNLSPEQSAGLLQRLQDALNFTLPEESIHQITTVGDLISASVPENEPQQA